MIKRERDMVWRTPQFASSVTLSQKKSSWRHQWMQQHEKLPGPERIRRPPSRCRTAESSTRPSSWGTRALPAKAANSTTRLQIFMPNFALIMSHKNCHRVSTTLCSDRWLGFIIAPAKKISKISELEVAVNVLQHVTVSELVFEQTLHKTIFVFKKAFVNFEPSVIRKEIEKERTKKSVTLS